MRICQYLLHSEYRDIFRADDMDHAAGQVAGMINKNGAAGRKMDNMYQQV